MALNRVQLIGNLGRDPEIRSTPSGDTVAILSLATSEKWKDKQTGELQEKTEWHRIVFFDARANALRDFTRKGSKLYIEGSLETKQYEKDGQTRYSTQIKGRSFEFLDGKPQDGHQGSSSSAPAPRAASQPKASQEASQAAVDDFFDDDIPF
jgi:single-strand DNA-binding protein